VQWLDCILLGETVKKLSEKIFNLSFWLLRNSYTVANKGAKSLGALIWHIASVAVFVVGTILVIGNITSFISGINYGKFYGPCDQPFQKRGDFLFPSYYIGCVGVRWLDNKEQIFKESK
jgi:hypothetical protein